MARIASYVAPLADPDLDEFRELAARMHLNVRIDTRARLCGQPAIELYARNQGNLLLATFRHAAQGLEWLQAGRQDASQ